MDYRICDEWADPEGSSDQWHSEDLLRLDGGFLCYQAPPDAPEIDARVDGPLTFGSFNNASKISETVIDLWASYFAKNRSRVSYRKSRQLADENVCKRSSACVPGERRRRRTPGVPRAYRVSHRSFRTLSVRRRRARYVPL